jgi:hypothetical protein
VRKDIRSVIGSGIHISNPRAKIFLRKWSAEKFVRIFAAMVESLVGASFDRWKRGVREQRKKQKLQEFMRYQAAKRIAMYARTLHQRQVTSGICPPPLRAVTAAGVGTVGAGVGPVVRSRGARAAARACATRKRRCAAHPGLLALAQGERKYANSASDSSGPAEGASR